MTDELSKVRDKFAAAEEIEAHDIQTPDPVESEGQAPAPRTPDEPSNGPPPEDPELAEKIRRSYEQPLNDFGNGQRYCIFFGEDVIFVPRVGWYVWSGSLWEKDPDNLLVRRKAQKIAAYIEREVDHIIPTPKEAKLIAEKAELLGEMEEFVKKPNDEKTEEDYKAAGQKESRIRAIGTLLKDRSSVIGKRLTHAKNAGNNGPLGHMLTESQTSLAVRYEDLDARDLDVNTESGVLRFKVDDLSDEGSGKMASYELIQHHRDQRLTKIMPVKYDRAAKCPKFMAFLERVLPDREVREFVQRWIGLSMTGLKIQNMAFFYGSGANGKSVLVDLVCRMMGNYAATARIESLTGSNRRGGGDATPDLIPLMGARMVRSSEPEQGDRLQEGKIKELTGGEPLLVRALHSDFVEVDPFFKLTMSGNHKPDIRGTDDGIWRRVLLICFGVQIPENERDPELGDKLFEERAGILNWMIDGLLDYLEGGLQVPKVVLDDTQEYREESDPIGTFLKDCCVVSGDPNDKISSADMVLAFNYWRKYGVGENEWKSTTFQRQISTKSKQWKDPATGMRFEKSKSSKSQYLGIRFNDDFGPRFKDAPRDAHGNILAEVLAEPSN